MDSEKISTYQNSLKFYTLFRFLTEVIASYILCFKLSREILVYINF